MHCRRHADHSDGEIAFALSALAAARRLGDVLDHQIADWTGVTPRPTPPPAVSLLIDALDLANSRFQLLRQGDGLLLGGANCLLAGGITMLSQFRRAEFNAEHIVHAAAQDASEHRVELSDLAQAHAQVPPHKIIRWDNLLDAVLGFVLRLNLNEVGLGVLGVDGRLLQEFQHGGRTSLILLHGLVELGVARLDPQPQIDFVGRHADLSRAGNGDRWLNSAKPRRVYNNAN